MPKIFLRATDIHTVPKRIHFDITKGWIDELPEFRGVNDEVPEVAGREWMPKEEDRRQIELLGGLYGTGATRAAQQADYLAAGQELAALLNPTQTPGELKVVGPYKGLPAGMQAVINVSYIGDSWQAHMGAVTFRRGVLVFESIDSAPNGPNWVLSAIP